MFTPVETSIGAVLLHQSTSVLLYQNGSVLGCSGILRRFLTAPTKESMSFMAGMVLSYLPLKTFLPQLLAHYPPLPTTLQAALVTLGMGALVGLGAKVCNHSAAIRTEAHELKAVERMYIWTYALRTRTA
jgi:uncharacterized protein